MQATTRGLSGRLNGPEQPCKDSLDTWSLGTTQKPGELTSSSEQHVAILQEKLDWLCRGMCALQWSRLAPVS